MKKIAVILLCVFTLASTALVYPIYQYFLSEVKLDAQLLTHSSIAKEQLITLSITKNDAKQKGVFKIIGNDEIVYKGHMYDVVSFSKHGDTCIYRCLSDHNEDELNNVFTQVLNLNTDHSNVPDNNQKSLIQNCVKEFLVCSPLYISNLRSNQTYHTQYLFSFNSSPCDNVPYSPPELV